MEQQPYFEARTMGILAHYEPSNTQELRKNAEVFSIFQATGWTEFFERLDGFNCEAALQFPLNLTETYSEVWGMRIEVCKAIIFEVTAIPQVGRVWFGRRVPTTTALKSFLIEGEQVQMSRRGIALHSLLQPWD